MKRKFMPLSAGLLLTGIFCGCSDNNEPGTERPAAGTAINFALSGDQSSRTVYDENDTYQINWVSGDKIRIYCDEAEDVTNADYEVIEPIDDTNKHTSTLKYNENGLKWGSEDMHHFYAVYPADDSRVSVSNGIATFKLNQNQVCTAGDADANGHYATQPDMQNAYMVANLTTAPVENVYLTFKPVMTTLNITVRGRNINEDKVTITGISIVNNNVRSSDVSNGVFKYDIANRQMVNSGTSSNTTTETTFVRIKDKNGNYYLDLESEQSVTFTVFLPPLSIDAANQVDVRVHATGETTQEVTIGGNADKNGNTVEYAASSKGNLTLPNFPSKKNDDTNNWITPLDDNIYVSQLSIPGTHDAATGDGTPNGLGETQERTLDEQFEMGIRAFDIRPAVKDNRIIICHGAVETTYEWEQVMARFEYYLQKNPGEFIIVLMRHETEYDGDNSNWGAMMQTRLQNIKDATNPATNESYAIDFRPDLTIGDMRGKILFLCRDWTKYNDNGPTVGGYMGWSHNINGAEVNIYGPDGSSGRLNIQDYYSASCHDSWISDTQIGALSSNNKLCSAFSTDKWSIIETQLDKSAQFHLGIDPTLINKWSINHTSGYTGSCTWYLVGYTVVSTIKGYRENAANNNVKFYNKITGTDWQGSTGIVISDFVGARTSGGYTVYGDLLPQTIIDNNYKYRMKRKGE